MVPNVMSSSTHGGRELHSQQWRDFQLHTSRGESETMTITSETQARQLSMPEQVTCPEKHSTVPL